jgi:hypothetical protein
LCKGNVGSAVDRIIYFPRSFRVRLSLQRPDLRLCVWLYGVGGGVRDVGELEMKSCSGNGQVVVFCNVGWSGFGLEIRVEREKRCVVHDAVCT